MKPHLEALEDRALPSTSPINPQPFIFTASPPAAPQVAVLLSLADSTMQQWSHLIATLRQDVIGQFQVLSQEIAQAVYTVQLQVDHIFDIDLNTTPAANTSDNSNSLVPTSARGSGSGSGVMATAYNAQDPALHKTAQPSGSGSGTDSSAAPSTPNKASQQGLVRMQRLASGSGSSSGGSSGSTSGAGIGSGFNTPSSGIPATVYGLVWLDNNGNGSIDNELGYVGATVNLYYYDNGTWDLYGTTTTDPNGKYTFSVFAPSPPNNQFEIQVVFPWSFEATIPGVSQINDQGYTQPFALAAGGQVQKTGGLRSMNVNTLGDDPNGPTQVNTVTLRDAIQTGNNGPPNPAVTFYSAPNTALNGTISLQTSLDPIKKSYNIDGSQASITVQGNANAQNPYRIFTVEGNTTCEIDNLVIKGGYLTGGFDGGGVYNSGTLTLKNDSISNNTIVGAGANGGGIYNYGGLTLISTNVNNNNAGNSGGGIFNHSGTITINNSDIYNNVAAAGGGIYNSTGETINMKNSGIDSNGVNEGGGGILNRGNMRLTNVAISNNSASFGGGIYMITGSLTLKAGCVIGSNTSVSGNGGGIDIYVGTVSISGGAIQGNTATNGNGGGIYSLGGTLSLFGGVTIGPSNSGTNGGGLCLRSASTTTFNGCTVSGNKASGLGVGVAYESGAELLNLPGLTDKDDLNGPVEIS